MKLHRLASQYQAIIWLIGETSSIDPSKLELEAHWARYLCVLSAGFLENALPEVYTAYAATCANYKVSNYVSSRLALLQNPKSGRFVETARSFDKTWAEELEAFLLIGGRKEAIDSIMSNRHQIVHGKNSNISLVRVIDYLAKSVEVVEYIEDQCGILQK